MTRDEERFGVQLGLVVEAGGRVATVAGRVMRWGLGAVDVVSNESNRDALLRELEDMRAAMRRVERELMGSHAELPGAPVDSGPVATSKRTCGHSNGPWPGAPVDSGPVATVTDSQALAVETVDASNGH